MRFARWFFYIWFALTFGMFVAGAITLLIGFTWSRNLSLTGAGGPLWLVSAAFIAMALVFGQWEHLGERVRIGRWLLISVVSALLAVAGFAMGAFFSL